MWTVEAFVKGPCTMSVRISEYPGCSSAVIALRKTGYTLHQLPVYARLHLNLLIDNKGKQSRGYSLLMCTRSWIRHFVGRIGIRHCGNYHLPTEPGDVEHNVVHSCTECPEMGELSISLPSSCVLGNIHGLIVALLGCLLVHLSNGDVVAARTSAEMPLSIFVESTTYQENEVQEASVRHQELSGLTESKDDKLSGRLCALTGLEIGRPGVLERQKVALPVMPRYRKSSNDEAAYHCVHHGARSGIRELEGDSFRGMNYGQILDGLRDKQNGKREMFTQDAWMGMMRLDQYSRYIHDLEEEELKCKECTRNRRLLEQVWQTVSNEYFDGDGSFSQSQWAGELYRGLSRTGGLLRTKAETYKAAKQMVAHLGDKYSSFLNPQEYRLAIHRPIPSELKYLAYQYTGIGIELGEQSPSGGFFVVAPFAGSPAEEAGILSGEQLLAIDDIRLNLLTKSEVGTLLRGPVGSIVELEVAGQETGIRRVLLERRALPLPPLKLQLIDAGAGRIISYIRLHYFTHEGTKQMAAAIREGEALGVDGYILDLRNNPGGVFEEAIAMAALWLDCGHCDVAETVRSKAADIEDLVYSTDKLPKDIFARHPGVLTHAPLVVITNRSSASASEVLTGALHDNHRVVTVGERTFGKGVVQYYFPMDDGSGLKLTVAKYLTPSRYDILKQGGLEADRVCHDYPHGSGRSDKCIEEALSVLSLEEEKQKSGPHQPPLPYRWMPLNQRPLWAVGSY